MRLTVKGALCLFSFSFSISLSLGEEELEASLRLAQWPCSQGYHLNNTGSLMTARPHAVIARLLSACTVAAGDCGGVLSSGGDSVRCCVLGWGGVGWGGRGFGEVWRSTQNPMVISQPAVCVKWTKQAAQWQRHHTFCSALFCFAFVYNALAMILQCVDT